MFRNQYLISSERTISSLPNFRNETFGELNIYVESKLRFYKKSINNIEIGFLGIFFDPLAPNLNGNDLLDKFLLPNSNIDLFLKELERFSGRFVALFRENDSYYITGDFKHSKNIFYSIQGNFTVISSSLNLFYTLFDKKPNIDPNIKTFFESERYFNKQQDWHGPKTLDKSFLKLLPNHYLTIKTKEVKRIPLSTPKLGFEEVIENSYQILKGSYEYLLKNHTIIQPLTAGWDSRILLGASLAYKNSIKYYIFKRSDNENTPDIHLSEKIAKAFDLNFPIFNVEEFKENFKKAYEKHTLNPNYLSKVKDIQFHYEYHASQENLVNVSGVSGNLFRFVYGCTNKIAPDKEEIYCLSAYGPYSKITTKEIDSWYGKAKKYALEYNVSLIDLFFIENRLGNWGSIYPYEQDMALDEVDPFSNKTLMYPILNLDKKFRGYGRNQLSSKLLERFDKRLCDFPFNPHKGPLHMFIIRNFETNLLYKKYKFIKSKILNGI